MKYISLCIPTNGIVEWVVPVLESIYNQRVEEELFEVIVTNNGDEDEYFDKVIDKYTISHTNFIYKRTSAPLFQNQIESLKMASGEFLKFVNHRAVLEKDSLKSMVEMVKNNIEQKPIIYMSNGALSRNDIVEYENFDLFVRGLREYASWTTGVGVWKNDFEQIPSNWIYNNISPHSDILFWVRDRGRYIIDDRTWSKEIESSHRKKGAYNLYKTFCVEEPAIILKLLIDGDISIETFQSELRSYETLVAGFYLKFNISKKECSYDIKDLNKYGNILLNKRNIIKNVIKIGAIGFLRKIKKD